MASGFSDYLRRDLLLAYRRRGEAASPLVFFIMVSTLIPLGISPESARLAEIAPGIIWVMALLATLLSTDGLFASGLSGRVIGAAFNQPANASHASVRKNHCTLDGDWTAIDSGVAFTGCDAVIARGGLCANGCQLGARYWLFEFNWCSGRGINCLSAQRRAFVVTVGHAPVYASDYIWQRDSAKRN